MKQFFKRNATFTLLFVWILSTAQQCTDTITDNCGSYTTAPNVVKVTPVIMINTVPYNVPLPIIQNTGTLVNAVNIQGSLYSTKPAIFGIKVESYDLCENRPRYESACCITKSSNGCYMSGTENIYQLSAIYQGAFKCKVTIRAIVDNHEQNGYLAGSFLYEGVVDLDPTIGNPSLNVACSLRYIKKLPSNPGPRPEVFCNYNE